MRGHDDVETVGASATGAGATGAGATGESGASTTAVLVSACLLGEPCRYDGAAKPCAAVRALRERPDVRLAPVCPEQLGGLPTPRPPSEIVVTAKGGRPRVMTREGADVTAAFERGAREAVRIARARGCAVAILKAKSPTCGCGPAGVYDGSFTGKLVAGEGVAARALREAGVRVTDEATFAREGLPTR
ncbi:DUF523 domain-containing protein [bacterium]|nr:DUF523 domain-containing protein [bacterium]